MPFSFPARSETKNCPTSAITSAHAEQEIQRKIDPGTSHRSGVQLHQHRRRAALLTDSFSRRSTCPHQPPDQSAWHRYITFPGSGSHAESAFRIPARSRASASCPLARLSPAEAAHLTPGAARESGVPYACEACGIEAEWNGEPMVWHEDHINGDWLDNRKENLRFLCRTVTRRPRHSLVDLRTRRGRSPTAGGAGFRRPTVWVRVPPAPQFNVTIHKNGPEVATGLGAFPTGPGSLGGQPWMQGVLEAVEGGGSGAQYAPGMAAGLQDAVKRMASIDLGS